MHLVAHFLQALLVAAFVVLAGTVALRPRRLTALASLAPQGRPGRVLVALLLALAGIATAAGLAVPFAAFFASLLGLAAAVVIAALAARSRSRGMWTIPAALALACLGVGAIEPLGLKVLALPKADELPQAPLESRVVKTYDEGVWFEGIAAGADGTLYLAANRGLDFSRGDYYRHARGEIIARSPSGEERSVMVTPEGVAAGVIAVADDGTLYMTSNADVPGLWRVGKDGRSEMFVHLPPGAWPNGLDIGPDGKLYTPDSHLGVIWRADPVTGRVERVVEDKRLLARPFISLAPGANGLHFRGRAMIVTVSDRTTVLEYPLGQDGTLGAPKVLATGIPGDDFAIGRDGSLFITTHPYNTIVRLSPSGERDVAGDARQHIVGATGAVFGRGADDAGTLYVVTDGGAFTGGPAARGELVALRPFAGR